MAQGRIRPHHTARAPFGAKEITTNGCGAIANVRAAMRAWRPKIVARMGSFAPPGLGGILLECFTHRLRSGLRPVARFAGYDAERARQRVLALSPLGLGAGGVIEPPQRSLCSLGPRFFDRHRTRKSALCLLLLRSWLTAYIKLDGYATRATGPSLPASTRSLLRGGRG